MKKIITLLVVLSSLYTHFLQAQTLDYCFVFVGCNRVDNAQAGGADSSTANVYHLNRTFSEVAQMNPLPKYFFFVGDLILGYTDGDSVILANEYNAWKQLYLNSPLASTSVQLVVMPGNHEVENNSTSTQALASAERTFVREMQPFILGNNGPKATGLVPGTDSLITDQSQLTYSFDYKNLSSKNDHFVVVNTDPVGRDFIAPFHWVDSNLTAARNNPETRHIFVFGHKPAYPSGSSPTDGLTMYPTYRNNFWNALENNRAEAMFSAHNHTWDTIHYLSYPKTIAWQVIAGNGGSPPASSFNPAYYGYTVVNIYTNGQVTLQNMGRTISAATYTASVPANPTTQRGTAINITYPTTINFQPFFNSGGSGPFSSQVTITDNDTVTSAYVVYTVNSGTSDTIRLTADSANVYKFTIPAQSDTTPGSISYKIVANGSTVATYPSSSTQASFVFNSPLAVIPPLPTAEDIKAYPNPTTGILTIDLSKHKGISGINIQNINGVSVKNIAITGSIINTDISTLAPGAYFLIFTASNGQQYVKKIIKN